MRREERKGWAESRRLLYVACTRARDLLVVPRRPVDADVGAFWKELVDRLPAATDADVRVVDAETVARPEAAGRGRELWALVKIWGPVAIPGGGWGGAPTVADFDGDGAPEIGIAGYSRYVVFRSDGTILWQSVTRDYSSKMTGSSVFDFDGDGQTEVVYNDEEYFRIYRGRDGAVLFQALNSTWTLTEYPVIADVDNDNRAEIVLAANDPGPFKTHHGIRVFEDANDNWVNTRKIWNQHSYHITNVNDDGSIPRYEENNWDIAL